MEVVDRMRLGKMTNPVRGLMDACAAALAVAGAAVLWSAGSGDRPRQVALVVFGLSMIGLFTVSSLYHSVPWRPAWKSRMQRMDHSMIYVLIAGSYTPIAAIVLDGWIRVATLVVAWGIAAAGIIQKAFFPKLRHTFSVTLQTTQGWLAVFLMVPLAQRLPWQALAVMLAGGVLYTVGMVFLVTNRPRLWPRVFSYHEMFHVLVIGGSCCQFFVTVRYIAPFAA